MTPLRILLVDEFTIFREGLRRILSEIPEFLIIGEAADTVTTLDLARRLEPDIVILDIALPGIDGLELTRRLHQAQTKIQIVILTAYAQDDFVLKALDAGATSFVHKGAECRVLIDAIHAAGRHEHYLCPLIRNDVIRQFLRERRDGHIGSRYDSLSSREQQVLRLIAEGHPTRRVADMLNVSPKTVEKHRVNLMRKLGLPNLVSLVKYAVSINLVEVMKEPLSRQEIPTMQRGIFLPKKEAPPTRQKA